MWVCLLGCILMDHKRGWNEGQLGKIKMFKYETMIWRICYTSKAFTHVSVSKIPAKIPARNKTKIIQILSLTYPNPALGSYNTGLVVTENRDWCHHASNSIAGILKCYAASIINTWIGFKKLNSSNIIDLIHTFRQVWINHFPNVFNEWTFLLPCLLKPTNQKFHSPASFNMNSIAGFPLCIDQLLLGRASSGKFCGRQNQPFLNRLCMNFEYITKVLY